MNLLCLLLLFYIVYSWSTKSGFFDRTVSVQTPGGSFKVLDHEKKEIAADILSKVNSDVLTLKSSFINKYHSSGNELYKQMSERFASTYSPESLKENYPRLKKKDVSYNLNKGQTLAICLRNYDTYDFHQYNEILFVTLHELAHSLNCNTSVPMCGNSYGHDDTFWRIFKILLQEAVELKIYSSKDYKKNPVNYCSMEITYNPLNDPTL